MLKETNLDNMEETMADEKDALAITIAVATECAKGIYLDVAHPTLKATGSILGLIPQTIDAALLPVHQWIAEKKYKLDETKKLLAEKLKNVSPEKIVSPDPYVAVPALQAISYSMDNEEIRNMYANLLASSMTEKVKKDVHPAFVEIIKQLSPDEAKILKYLYEQKSSQPIITLRIEKNGGQGCDVIKHFTILYRAVSNLEYNDYKKISILLDNLSRQELIVIHENRQLTAPNTYTDLEQDFVILEYTNQTAPSGYNWKINRMFFELTALGMSFCRVCIADPAEKTIGEQG